MGLPGPEADPAEVRLAGLVLANHVVAAPVLLYRGAALKRDAVFRNTEKCIGGITSKLTFRPNLEHCIASQIAVMECNRIEKNPGSKLTQVKMSSLDDCHTHESLTVGHSLVLAEIQLLVSLSSSHFLIHFLMR